MIRKLLLKKFTSIMTTPDWPALKNFIFYNVFVSSLYLPLIFLIVIFSLAVWRWIKH